MKRSKRLVILLLVLVVVGGAAAAAACLLPDEDLESYETIELLNFEAEDAAALSYSYDGESIELENEDGEWKYTLDSAFPLDTDYVDSMLAALSGLTATAEIEAPDDKAPVELLGMRVLDEIIASELEVLRGQIAENGIMSLLQ